MCLNRQTRGKNVCISNKHMILLRRSIERMSLHDIDSIRQNENNMPIRTWKVNLHVFFSSILTWNQHPWAWYNSQVYLQKQAHVNSNIC